MKRAREAKSPRLHPRRLETVSEYLAMTKLTVMLAILVTLATCAASCSSKTDQPPGMNVANMQMSPAPAGSCQIDAVKMCQAEGSSTTPSSQPATTSSYG